MNNDSYLGMRPGDLDGKPYARYWNPGMRDLSGEVAQALMQSPMPACYGLLHRERGRLLEPGYLPLENGYTQLPSGEMYVAVHTPMPGVSGDMIDWWFGWHSDESQRYKLWHPRAHRRATMRTGVDVSAQLSDRERYVGNTSCVDEYIGDKVLRLAIQFKTPQEFGLDPAEFAAAGVQTAICAEVGPANLPFNFGKLVHLIRGTGDGCEMRSRFWLGKLSLRGKPPPHPANRVLGSRLLSKLATGRAQGHDMVVHCAMEMAHLADFLPALFADYHPEHRVQQAPIAPHSPQATRPTLARKPTTMPGIRCEGSRI